jgi:hypothetical protein
MDYIESATSRIFGAKFSTNLVQQYNKYVSSYDLTRVTLQKQRYLIELYGMDLSDILVIEEMHIVRTVLYLSDPHA